MGLFVISYSYKSTLLYFGANKGTYWLFMVAKFFHDTMDILFAKEERRWQEHMLLTFH